MPDEISHLIWAYLLLKHPSVRAHPDFRRRRDIIATYLFAMLPDLGNLLMALIMLSFMQSNNIPAVAGPEAFMQYPIVQDAFNQIHVIYYVFHSYVTLGVLLAIAYVALRRVYWPLLLGLGLHLTLDVFTHRDMTALKPLYPLFDTTVSGIVHW
ncbi:MAG: hypothetical protein PHG85_04960, partial [Candidatus Altiarchaeota archaeon]|nr:hypothetical protein [Candidatus Altiarchaeota archaeon]